MADGDDRGPQRGGAFLPGVAVQTGGCGDRKEPSESPVP